MTTDNKAVVLVSGGLDSATTLAIAKDGGFDCHALSFDYGQRHRIELSAARRVAIHFGVREHKIVKLDLGQIGGSALTDLSIAVPDKPQEQIPITYVPARNTIFLSCALAWAEVLDTQDIFIGINAVDYSGYPDCRPEYIAAFRQLARLATRAGVEGKSFEVHTPLIDLSKTDIIKRGASLGVDYSMTISCYQANEIGQACRHCDACHLREAGFKQAGIADPTIYQNDN